MVELNAAGQGTLTGRKLKLFSLTLDHAAGLRAHWATNTIAKLAGESWHCNAGHWKRASLQSSGTIRSLITSEGARADVILIAASSLNHRDVDLVQWLANLDPGPAGRSAQGLLIGLFGDETNQARELDWTVKRFMGAAQRLNRDFIWHWMEEPAQGEPEWLVTHLEDFLARKLLANDHPYRPAAMAFA